MRKICNCSNFSRVIKHNFLLLFKNEIRDYSTNVCLLRIFDSYFHLYSWNYIVFMKNFDFHFLIGLMISDSVTMIRYFLRNVRFCLWLHVWHRVDQIVFLISYKLEIKYLISLSMRISRLQSVQILCWRSCVVQPQVLCMRLLLNLNNFSFNSKTICFLKSGLSVILWSSGSEVNAIILFFLNK